MAILKYLYPVTFALLLSGCYEDFVPKIDVGPVLCINSVITAGQPIDVSVSHSWMYDSESGERHHAVAEPPFMSMVPFKAETIFPVKVMIYISLPGARNMVLPRLR